MSVSPEMKRFLEEVYPKAAKLAQETMERWAKDKLPIEVGTLASGLLFVGGSKTIRTLDEAVEALKQLWPLVTPMAGGPVNGGTSNAVRKREG